MYFHARTNCYVHVNPTFFSSFVHLFAPTTSPLTTSRKPSNLHPPDHQAHLTDGWTPEVGQRCRQMGTLPTTAILKCEIPTYQPARKGWRRIFWNWAILPSADWGSFFLAVSSGWKVGVWKFVNGVACTRFAVSNPIFPHKMRLI